LHAILKPMRRHVICLLFILGLTRAEAQINELGIFLGGANYIGDIGPTNYIKPNEFAIGAMYRWNRSPRHSWRFSIIHSKLTSRDEDSDVPSRYQRDLDFENSVTEFSAGLEFSFFDFNLHELDTKVTPYVYTGLSYFIYDELFYDADVTAKKDYTESALAIPMIVGVKTNIAPKLILGLEVGARYTFTDNLDGSNPKNEDLAAARFANIASKDWYVFTGITLTYTFTEKPCYCAE
jgi:hypothetical protein